MKTITKTVNTELKKKSVVRRSKIQSRLSNNFNNPSRVLLKTKTGSSASYLFEEEKLATSPATPRKLRLRNKEHLRRIILSGRDAYNQRRGVSYRHTFVMRLIKTLVDTLRATAEKVIDISTDAPEQLASTAAQTA